MKTAVYLSYDQTIENLDKIVEVLEEDIEDLFLVNDSIETKIENTQFAVINIHHIFFAHDVRTIFLTPDSFNLRSADLAGPSVVVVNKEELWNIQPDLIKDNTVVLIKKADTIRKAKNAELQSVFRK